MWSTAHVTRAPDSLPTDTKALRALLLAERARHAEELAAARSEATQQVAERDHEIERLMAIIKELQRHRFGRRAERLDPSRCPSRPGGACCCSS
jgi:transposase